MSAARHVEIGAKFPVVAVEVVDRMGFLRPGTLVVGFSTSIRAVSYLGTYLKCSDTARSKAFCNISGAVSREPSPETLLEYCTLLWQLADLNSTWEVGKTAELLNSAWSVNSFGSG